MYQDPRFYAKELSKAARHELDRAAERIMKRWFRPEVGSEIAVAVLMKACAERLSETEDGQDRLIRHLKGWADTVTRNEAWMRAHRARGGNADAPLPPGADLRPATGIGDDLRAAPVPPTAPSRYRPAGDQVDSPPPGTMRERWAAREAARSRAGGHPQPTAEEIQLLRQAAAIASGGALSEPQQAAPLRTSLTPPPASGPIDPPWSQDDMPADPHWAETAADTGSMATRPRQPAATLPVRAGPATTPRPASPPADPPQPAPAPRAPRPTATDLGTDRQGPPGPSTLADFLNRL